MDPSQQAVHNRDESYEGDEDRSDVERQIKPLAGPARRCVDHVHIGCMGLARHSSESLRSFRFRLEHLGHQDRAGRGHDDGRQHVLHRDTADPDVRHQQRARDRCHPPRHHGHQFRACKLVEIGPDCQRSFRLSHEDVRRHVQRLSAAGPHHSLHYECNAAYGLLHDAQVIQHCEQRRDENDQRQNLEREDGPRSAPGNCPTRRTRTVFPPLLTASSG